MQKKIHIASGALDNAHYMRIYYCKEILMKRKDLVAKLEKAGFILYRNGGSHDIYKRGAEEIPIPRHREINERLAKRIIKELRL